MKKVRVIFEVVDKDEPFPPGCKNIFDEFNYSKTKDIIRVISVVMAFLLIAVSVFAVLEIFVVERYYTANIFSKTYHQTDCPYTKSISGPNRRTFKKTRWYFIKHNYTRCTRCTP